MLHLDLNACNAALRATKLLSARTGRRNASPADPKPLKVLRPPWPNRMVMIEDQDGPQRPACPMMDPGISSLRMGVGFFSPYVDHLKKLNFLVREIS